MRFRISLELGGSNSVRNLWPQSYQTAPRNAHVKDKLENRLQTDVCSGKLNIKATQQGITTGLPATQNVMSVCDRVAIVSILSRPASREQQGKQS